MHDGKVHVTNKEIIGPELPHEHYKADNDSPEYWEDILQYLLMLKLPKEKDLAKVIKNQAKLFFI